MERNKYNQDWMQSLQTKDTSSVAEPLSVPEPTAMRSCEVESSLTSPESGKETSRDAVESTKTEEKRKMVSKLYWYTPF